MGKTKLTIEFEAIKLTGEVIRSNSVIQKGVILWLMNQDSKRWIPCKFGTLKIINNE